MDFLFKWPRTLRFVGTVCLVGGLIDPLEGSVVILIGGCLLVFGAFLGRSRQRAVLAVALGLLALGIGGMFALSTMGGVGGDTGRSMAWLVLLAPYPIGWALALTGAVRWYRE